MLTLDELKTYTPMDAWNGDERSGNCVAGVVFMNLETAPAARAGRHRRGAADPSTPGSSYVWPTDWIPHHVKYKIRMDSDNVPGTDKTKTR